MFGELDMEREELVKKVIAMLSTVEKVYNSIKDIKTSERLAKVLNVLKLETDRALIFLLFL